MARKIVKKWNPKYSKTSVRIALQNALAKRCYGELSKEDKSFIKEILSECDGVVLKIEDLEESK